MGFRRGMTSGLVSVFLMALIWQLSESGMFRDMTGTFIGKIIVSALAFIIAYVVGVFLSGGK